MKSTTQIWGLWDCEELLSVHLNQDDARDAKDEHLGRCRCFADHDVIDSAVEIRTIRLPTDPGPVENRDRATCAGHDRDATFGREKETSRFPVGGHTHADH